MNRQTDIGRTGPKKRAPCILSRHKEFPSLKLDLETDLSGVHMKHAPKGF